MTNENNNNIDDQIKKITKGWYKSFRLREVDAEELKTEQCDPDIRCVEIYGVWPEPVPDPNGDPNATSVCRVYKAGNKTIVCWTNRWYKYFDTVADCIRQAKQMLS